MPSTFCVEKIPRALNSNYVRKYRSGLLSEIVITTKEALKVFSRRDFTSPPDIKTGFWRTKAVNIIDQLAERSINRRWQNHGCDNPRWTCELKFKSVFVLFLRCLLIPSRRKSLGFSTHRNWAAKICKRCSWRRWNAGNKKFDFIAFPGFLLKIEVFQKENVDYSCSQNWRSFKSKSRWVVLCVERWLVIDVYCGITFSLNSDLYWNVIKIIDDEYGLPIYVQKINTCKLCMSCHIIAQTNVTTHTHNNLIFKE